jgi:HEPN domain-containing protein
MCPAVTLSHQVGRHSAVALLLKAALIVLNLYYSIIFINNLVDDLNKDNTDPVVIGDTSVNILLYADDIVLLSQSKEGLQNSLAVTLSHQVGRHSAVALLLKAALIQVSDYSLLGASGSIYSQIEITVVNILLYADDIVLLSQSKEGLQNSLNILHDFCYSWKLKVKKQ